MTETIQRAARALQLRDKSFAPDEELEPVYIAATACRETLLDPSEEAVRVAYNTMNEHPSYCSFEGMRAAIRAYHMTILGREE